MSDIALPDPAAIEMERVYDAMEIFMGEAFIATASGGYLDAVAQQYCELTRLVGENDAAFRKRCTARLAAPIGAGNEADYASWAMQTGLVGYVTVEPVWAGAGTVRVLVATPARGIVGAPDLTTIANYIETKRPIGATVTVASIVADVVTIHATLNVKPGYVKDAALTAKLVSHLGDYIDTLGPGDDVLYNEVIRYLLEVDGVADMTALTINAVAATLAVAANHLATFPSDGSTFTLS
jgi:uncharacterized phage protein gp47/JayE